MTSMRLSIGSSPRVNVGVALSVTTVRVVAAVMVGVGCVVAIRLILTWVSAVSAFPMGRGDAERAG